VNLRALKEEQATRIFRRELEKRKTDAFKYDWPRHARPEQLAPDWPWRTWLYLGGRGTGKTRAGGEQVRIWVRDNEFVNLIGATASDARDILIEGESGILAICPRHERPEWLPTKQRLSWPNGAKSLIFTSEEPERLRGKQHQKLLMDELASWKLPETYDQAMLGLRIGKNPQTMITTTPRPIKRIKDLMADPTTAVSRGTTKDNMANLAPAFLADIVRQYEGTRMGRQELDGEILTDNPSALWKRSDIDSARIRADQMPTLVRVVVAIDPAVTSNADSDLTGIIVAGVGYPKLGGPLHGYILADYSMSGTPDVWAGRAVGAYRRHDADRIVAETNNGGDLVENVIRTVDKEVPYRKVHASRGKAIRAEPIAALYEQGRVHHVGSFPELEDQMCDFDPTQPAGAPRRTSDTMVVHKNTSPDRMDACVWAMSDLTQGPSRTGNVTELRI
jgi:phage terminase large subunit-like protein